MRKLLFTDGIVILFLSASAQDKTVSGKVTDEKDGTPPQVTVCPRTNIALRPLPMAPSV
jgi:hypothetical protein